jgi:hypothetical protein
MVTATWNHGLQHSFVSVGHTLNGMLKSLEELEYVKEVMHYEITREEYESFYSASLDEVEAPVKNAEHKNSRSKKGLPAFSSLENFFGEQKVPAKKSRRK